MLHSQALELAYKHRWKDAKDGDRSYARAHRIASVNGLVFTTGDLKEVASRVQTLYSLSPASVNRHVAAYLGMLDTLADLGALSRSQIPKWRPLRESNGRDYSPSADDVNRFIRTAANRGGPHSLAIRSLAYLLSRTGLRLGEALALTPEDLVHHEGRAYLTVVESKSGHSRLVPVPRDGLLRHNFLTLLIDFEGLSRSSIYRAWHNIRESADLPTAFTPHALRHYRASQLAAAGVAIPTIAAILGHRDWKTTQRYTHVDHATMADAVDRVSEREREVYVEASRAGTPTDEAACSCPEDEIDA